MQQSTPRADLTLADLPEDLRDEGARLKARYHALASDAGLLTEEGAMDVRKLDDLSFVKTANLGMLRDLLGTSEKLLLLDMYRALPDAVRVACPFAEFSAPAFAPDRFSAEQWAYVQTIVRQSGGVVDAGSFAPLRAAGLTCLGDLDLADTGITFLPDYFEVHGLLYLDNCSALTVLPTSFAVGHDLSLIGCSSLTSIPWGMKVKGDVILSEGADVLIEQARAFALMDHIMGRVLVIHP